MSRFASSLSVLLLLTPLVQADSVWPAGNTRGMLADRRASRAGDIVTILVQESVASQNSQSSKADKASKADNAITQFLFPLAASAAGTKGGTYPGTAFDGSSSVLLRRRDQQQGFTHLARRGPRHRCVAQRQPRP